MMAAQGATPSDKRFRWFEPADSECVELMLYTAHTVWDDAKGSFERSHGLRILENRKSGGVTSITFS